MSATTQDPSRNKLYEFSAKVVRGPSDSLPQGMIGAYVSCYVGAPDPETAVRRGVEAISQLNHKFRGIHGPVRELPVEQWDDYVAKVWPEFADGLPKGGELPGILETGAVFFGPFIGFEKEQV